MRCWAYRFYLCIVFEACLTSFIEVRQADDQYPNMAFKSILLVHHINRLSLKEPCKVVHSYPHKARPAFFWCPADVRGDDAVLCLQKRVVCLDGLA